MTVKDYADLLPYETDFNRPQMWSLWKSVIAGMQPSMSSPLWAIRDARPVEGHFPAVIYAPSLNAMSWENADLCEYLASHGYVVIATPDFGITTREIPRTIPGIESEAQDISFLIGYAQTLTDTDMSKVAVHSVLPLTRVASSATGIVLATAGQTTGWPIAAGGAQAITNALAGYLKTLGGKVILGNAVKNIYDIPNADVTLFDTSVSSLAHIAGRCLRVATLIS